ncbi:MAG TPA: hypothetical protein VGV37_06825 [Aliidongia sp.]|uniref:hypothetical protein n=1 Tax=Aliidongia sp. TaxID=1914230 RepID=UPI002DDDB123|nr:hypothetical protein [Aliidongia sp.]HEV2674240.1 hypothetical protein [Aliidongia sp.]
MLAADFVAATGTTGTGTWTLTALANFANFNEPYGPSGTYRVVYSARDGVGNFEAGYGQLTLGTGNTSTLTRSPRKTRTSSGTYVTGTGASPLNFTTAPTVELDPVSFNLFPSTGPLYSGGNWTPIGQVASIQAAGFTANASDTIYRCTFDWDIGAPVSSFGVYIDSGNAAGHIRLAIYAPLLDGDAGALMWDSGDLSTAATGNVGSTGGLDLPPGQYFLDMNTNISTVKLCPNSYEFKRPSLLDAAYYENRVRLWSKASTYGAPASVAPTTSSGFSALAPNTYLSPCLYVRP